MKNGILPALTKVSARTRMSRISSAQVRAVYLELSGEKVK
jgi:hypothetical protein